MDKSKVKTKLLMGLIYIIFLIIVAVAPQQVLLFFKDVLIKVIFFYNRETYEETIFLLVMSCLIGIGLYFAFRGHYYRFRLALHDFTHNTYSRGKSRWKTRKEEKITILEIEDGNELFGGHLVGQFRKIKLFGLFEIAKLPYVNLKQQVSEEIIETMGANLPLFTKQREEIFRKLYGYKPSWFKIQASFIRACPFLKEVHVTQIYNSVVHSWINATTRGGKTMNLIINQILYYARLKNEDEKISMVITDPKGELFRSTHKKLKNAGYDVFKIDLTNTAQSNSYSLIEKIMENYKFLLDENNIKIQVLGSPCLDNEIEIGDITRLRYRVKDIDMSLVTGEIDRIANSLFPSDTDGENAIFTKMANATFKSQIYVFMEECLISGKDYEFNLFNFIARSKDYFAEVGLGANKTIQLKKILEEIPFSNYAKLNLTSNLSGKTFQSIVSTFESELTLYTSDSVAKLTENNSVSFKKLVKGDRPFAYYLVTPDYETKYNKIVSNFIDQLYYESVMFADNNGGKLNRKIHFILEEFANVPRIENFDKKMTVCLGRGLFFTLVTQNKAQFVEVYGEHVAETIIDNTQIKIYLLAGSMETLEFFSKTFGETTQLVSHYTGRKYSEMTKDTSEDQVRLVSPEELKVTPFGMGYMDILREYPSKQYFRPAFLYAFGEEEEEEE